MNSYLKYEQLTRPACQAPAGTACERKNGYHILTERHLQAMWLEQKYFKQLHTTEGAPITVSSPGIWNSEAGPDFLKAHLRIGNRELIGDVELHLSSDSWIHHRHHEDPRYNRVILHVSYWPAANKKAILTSEQTPIAGTFLQPFLTVPESRLLKLIDLDLYPYQHFAGSGQCAKELFSKLSKEKSIELLRSAAVWRLREKWQRLVTAVENPAGVLMGGISLVLGYKHNANAFMNLYNYLASLHIDDEKLIFSLALGLSGYYSERFKTRWNASPYYRQLHEMYEKVESNLKSRTFLLQLDHIRPPNNPVRRLAILSKIITNSNLHSLGHAIAACWEAGYRSGPADGWRSLRSHFMACVPEFQDTHFETHYAFEDAEQPFAMRLMGEDLKIRCVVNIFFPFLYSILEKRASISEWEAFEKFYATWGAGKAKKSDYLSHRFFGDAPKKLSLLRADIQQGAYQIHKDFCMHYEASCEGCPFVQRYREVFT